MQFFRIINAELLTPNKYHLSGLGEGRTDAAIRDGEFSKLVSADNAVLRQIRSSAVLPMRTPELVDHTTSEGTFRPPSEPAMGWVTHGETGCVRCTVPGGG